MDRLDLPNQLEVTILDEVCLVFSKLQKVDVGQQVVYNAHPPLSKKALDRILLCESLTLEDMGIIPLDPPVVKADTAHAIAEIITKELHKVGFSALGNAHSWKIVPTRPQYHNDEEVRLSLVVIP